MRKLFLFIAAALVAITASAKVININGDEACSLKNAVDDGVSGWIVPECNLSIYATTLLQLMSNKELRERMAVNAVHHSRGFSQDIVGEKWWRALNES